MDIITKLPPLDCLLCFHYKFSKMFCLCKLGIMKGCERVDVTKENTEEMW